MYNRSVTATFGNADDLNQKIFKSLRIAEDIIKYALKISGLDPIKFLKEKFSPDFNMDLYLANRNERGLKNEKPDRNPDLYFHIEEYIQSKTKKVCKDMPRI